MKPSTLERVSGFLRYALIATAIGYLLLYVAVAVLRLAYPFELEWAEGGSLVQVARILEGKRLYVSPSPEFVPFIYPPLYFYLSAAVAALTGLGFLPLRLVSFLASLGCFAIIFMLVRRETRNALAGLVAACLFAACFRLGGAWFDVARIDSLFLFFLLAAVYALRLGASARSYALAGLLMALACLTKQTALMFVAPLVLYALVAHRRPALALIATLALILGLSTWILNYLHAGWYNYYLFELPQQHTIMKSVVLNFWRRDLLASLPLACLLAGFYFFARLGTAGKDGLLFYLLASAAMIGGSWAARLNLGGARNALFPAYAMIAILCGLAFHELLQLTAAAPPARKPALQAYVTLVCLLQFLLLAYNPLPQVPPRRDREAGQALVAAIRQMPGDVFIPSHGYLGLLAGKNGTAHWMAMGELFAVFGGAPTPAGAALAEEIRQAIRAQRYGAIILDHDWGVFEEEIERYYVRQGPTFADERLFRTVTGEMLRPDWIYVPRR